MACDNLQDLGVGGTRLQSQLERNRWTLLLSMVMLLQIQMHFLSGSCHDICKYGRRRPLKEHPTKLRHKKSAKLSVVIPSPKKKEAGNGQPSPSSDAKSFSPKTKNHSPRQNNTSSKRGVFQVEESNSVASKMFKQKVKVKVKPSSPRHSSDGVCGKRRRNEDVQSRQPSMLSGGALLSS